MGKLIVFKRVAWIDCTKLIAICAVVVDHTNGFLYNGGLISNHPLTIASYFSVTLFTMLAGITAWKAYERSERTFCIENDWKKAWSLFLSYAAAVAVYQVYREHFFDVKSYLSNVFTFSYHGLFYFVLFFLQLSLLRSVLLAWLQYCNSKGGAILHIATLFGLGTICSILIRYTFVLPTHGGGQFLFGGTYLLLYYLGMLFANKNMFVQSAKKKMIILLASCVLWVIWLRLQCEDRLLFTKYMEPIWGTGFNPPSVNLIVFALLTLAICYAFFSMMEMSNNCFIKKALKFLSYLGSKTWYIFLYHLIVRYIIVEYAPFFVQNIWVRRIVVFSAMLIVPAIIMSAVGLIKKKVNASIRKYYEKSDNI